MLRMEKFDKNFSFAIREMRITIYSFFSLSLVIHNFLALNVFEPPIPSFHIGSLLYIFFFSFFFQRFCWFSCSKNYLKFISRLCTYIMFLKLMNHLRGFSMMNGRCCIGNNNDVSLFISVFFSFIFFPRLFIGIVLSFHYMLT